MGTMCYIEVKIFTDHKPLISILNNKNIGTIGSNRLQRLKLKLLKYDLDVNYTPGKHLCVVVALSRSYLQDTVLEDETMCCYIEVYIPMYRRIHYNRYFMQIHVPPMLLIAHFTCCLPCSHPQ